MVDVINKSEVSGLSSHTMASPPPANDMFVDAAEVSASRKRKLRFDDEPEHLGMPLIELPAAKVSRKLPAFLARRMYKTTSPSPPESGEVSPVHEDSEVEEEEDYETDKIILERALAYLNKRIHAVRAGLKEGQLNSSQDSDSSASLGSNRVSYSQDSQLSGNEPPSIELVVRIIIESLSDDRLERLFAFKQVKDMELQVAMVVSQVNCDLLFFRELVSESLEVLQSPLGKGQPTFARSLSDST